MSGQTVGVTIQVYPIQVLAALKKIQEAAKDAGRDLKSMADIDFPGLEDAAKTLREVQRGLDQMRSKVVRGGTAEAFRAGISSGMYGNDLVSVMQNSGRQFPDANAQQRFLNNLVQQASTLSRMGSTPTTPAEGGGGVGGIISGILPMAKAILPMLGVGLGMGFVAKKVGESSDEAVGMSDFRRNVRGLDDDFTAFREKVRAAGDGLGLTYSETLKLSREYANLSGAMGADRVAAGTREGTLLARRFGLDAGQGVNMVGRANWLGMRDASKMLAEAMVRSGLGGSRMAEAAEAMVRYAEHNTQATGSAGNTTAFAEAYAALTRFGAPGMRANAENILSGYDSAIRGGGRAGAAGQNFIYNVLAQHGVNDPLRAQRAIEGGFFGDIGNGKTLGFSLIDQMRSQYGGRKDSDLWMQAGMSGLFGGSMRAAEEALKAFKGYEADRNKPGSMQALRDEIARIEKDYGKKDLGQEVRDSSAEINNNLKTLLGDRLLPTVTGAKGILADILTVLDHAFPGTKMERDRRHAILAYANEQAEAFGLDKTLDYDKEGRTKARNWSAILGGNSFSWNSRARAFAYLQENHRDTDGKLYLPNERELSDTAGLLDSGRIKADWLGNYLSNTNKMDAIRAAANKYGIDGRIAMRMVAAESGGNPFAISKTGAAGLMQLTMGTAKQYGLSAQGRFNAEANLDAGFHYLSDLRAKYGGDMYKALAAYNNGPGNIDAGKYKIPLPGGGTQDADAYAKGIMVQVEVIHKDANGNEIRREIKPGGRIKPPSPVLATN